MDTRTFSGSEKYDEDVIRSALTEGKAVYEVMGLEGDMKSIWDPNDAVQVEAKRREYEQMVKDNKYKAYRVTDDGSTGEPMNSFEASQGRVIFVPPMRAG